MDWDVIIIGGGAAGLMCALTAGQRGRRVRVIESANKVGKKILMSGGGRCNFTNLDVTPDNYLSANPHFCRSALARYTPADFIALVEQHGIAYHEKERGQLFCDQSSKQILRMLLDECAAAGVEIGTGCAISEVQHDGARFSVKTSEGAMRSEALVVASGGLSIPKMGATGFGYDLAQQFGHRVLPTRAGLVPLTLSGRPQEEFAGLSGVAAPAAVHCNGQQFDAPVLITHRGLSGPAILQISSYWQEGDELEIDWLPGENAGDWLRALKGERPGSDILTPLSEVLPRRLAERLCALQGVAAPLQHFSAQALAALGARLNHWPIRCSGTEGYRTAEVTLGGVDTDGLSSRTLESRQRPGLFFIGEVVDVTGHLGGYNFQWAWASGHAAGQVC